MTTMTHKAVAVTSSALLLASMGATAAVTLGSGTAQAATPDVAAEAAEEGIVAGNVMLDEVMGTFSYTQAQGATVDVIRSAMAKASQYLCAGLPMVEGDIDASTWAIDIRGAVDHSYTTTIGALQADDELVSQLMGCACAGNPADGGAAVNAEVTGVPVTTLLERAGVAADANTVVLRSADGYEIALPLVYLKTHYCPIVFNVAGSPIAESMGGANQLWLGSTAAKYFARDIISVTVEVRDEAPASPEADADTYANLPNVGVAFGGEVA
ncbi:molybdopterin-dependent oxidoreductase [uncultured Adlercreutzia sp.]|uniref:molybdopterin-dependent oxidoreductase n=1 Tax=uncultured Adlercreutzia sp. TaxID=875803 RepID=UPI0026F3D99E|nr:molybdopterin-dependent oxidoreductase [uncultured Adlercreutzia sp.]